ncbi:uncharacterized protein LOC131881487 [Tigriopus californicus]|uniref:uncharacterized protein LOC131881487 n=1 Tax=Tigriopus californicus TaxID=6832 RepID=UPI0027DA9A60|nr:uncharacterized protein LOC131881487 [Tigriopus californicus]XP_059084355.1 uncharacterized protein LOC131881487 [Tigriopus californicus]
MTKEFEVTVEPLGAAANPQSSLATSSGAAIMAMKSAVNVPQETSCSSSASKPSTSFQADEGVGESEKALLNSSGQGGTLQVRRARRNVRLKSAPHEEFLLPPIASQENVNVALDEGGMPLPPVSPMSIAQGMVSAFSIVRKVSQRVSSNKKQQEPASAFRRRASRRASRRAAGQLRRAGSNSRRSPAASAATPSAFSRTPLIRPNGQVGLNNAVEDAELGDPDDEDTDEEEGEATRESQSGKQMVREMIQSGWQQFLLMVGLRSEERKITSVAEIIKGKGNRKRKTLVSLRYSN